MRTYKVAALIVLTFIVSAVMAVGEVATGEQKYVDATGMYAIIRGDVGAARDRALEDARRKAVESVVGSMVDSQTLVENFQLVSDRIYSQTAGYICGEQITNERQDQYNYFVTIHACVSTGNLEDNLLSIGICLRRLDSPRTMLMIAEQNFGQRYHGWWEAGASNMSIVEQKLMEAFDAKGFPLIDPQVAQGKISAPRAVGGEPDPSYAVQVGKAYDAEYVVIGKAMVTCNPPDSYGFYNCYATVTTKIVKVDNGRIIGTASSTNAKAAHIEATESGTRALRKAAEEVGPKLIKSVTQRCEKETSGGNEFKVVLLNAGVRAKMKAFTDALKEARGVSSVTVRSYANGTADLEIMFKGRANDLADIIEDVTNGDVIEQTQNTLKVRLK